MLFPANVLITLYEHEPEKIVLSMPLELLPVPKCFPEISTMSGLSICSLLPKCRPNELGSLLVPPKYYVLTLKPSA